MFVTTVHGETLIMRRVGTLGQPLMLSEFKFFLYITYVAKAGSFAFKSKESGSLEPNWIKVAL